MRKLLLAVSASLCLLAQPMVASASNLVASISISSQTMTVTQNGVVKHRWKVSTARKGYVTPLGNYRAKWASKNPSLAQVRQRTHALCDLLPRRLCRPRDL